MKYIYTPENTCSTEIEFELEGNIVKNVKFTGGCPGNLQAITRLVDGMKVEEIKEKLGGIRCGLKNTSCANEFVKAIVDAYRKENNN